MTYSHSPGPWKAYERSERCPIPAGVAVEVGTEAGHGARTGTICEMVGQGAGKYDPRVTDANARLIAAAPELLDALHDALAELSPLMLAYRAEHAETILSKVRAALAKAEGRTEGA
jgi:hypothetical protein